MFKFSKNRKQYHQIKVFTQVVVNDRIYGLPRRMTHKPSDFYPKIKNSKPSMYDVPLDFKPDNKQSNI